MLKHLLGINLDWELGKLINLLYICNMEYDNIKCGTSAIYKIKIDGIDNQLVINELFSYKEMGYELNISIPSESN